MNYIDAHVHLADPSYAGKVEGILEESVKNGVTRLLSNAVDYSTSVQTISLAKQYEGTVFAAVGVHPSTVIHEPTLDLSQFERLIDENKAHVNAIGEIGLDGKYTQDKAVRKRQREIFKFFLTTAAERHLPVVIHSRLAADEVLEDLAEFDSLKVLLHWYDGPVENLESIKTHGYMLSFGPSLLYSKRLAEIARRTDLSTILSETDGPVAYHGPFQGKMTEPSFVTDVIRRLAEIRSGRVQVIRDEVWNNFEKFLRSSKSGNSGNPAMDSAP